jgi:hypothetical protein
MAGLTVRTSTVKKQRILKRTPEQAFFLIGCYRLFNDNLGARFGFASKALGLYFAETNDAVFGSVNGEVAAGKCTRTCSFSLAHLADENFALADFLAAIAFNTQALTGGIVYVFTGTTSFHM